MANSEPLTSASRSYSEGIKSSRHVDGWTRGVSGLSCQLCTWWSRDGQVWPADHEMPTPRLHTALVAATGRLADPSDMPFDDAHLDDDEALTTALDDLLARKPHLASRRSRGDVGQGATSTGGAAVDLGGLLRQRA